jgi:hypothetical protein
MSPEINPHMHPNPSSSNGSRRRVLTSGFSPSLAWLPIVLVAAVAGCGPKGPALVPAKGTITVDGKPADGASLIFHPVASKGAIASAAADAAGAFSVMSNGNPGIVTGTYKVTVTWPDPEKRPKEITLGGTIQDAPDLLGGKFVTVDKAATTVEITPATKQLAPIELSTK